MAAPRKPRFSTREALQDAVVSECLRELNEIFDREIDPARRASIRWSVAQSRHWCEDRHDPERERELDESRRASRAYLAVRKAILDFDTWAKSVEGTPYASRWPQRMVLEHLAPALVPLVREPWRFFHILSEGQAHGLQLMASTWPQFGPREHVIWKLDEGFRSYEALYNAFGLRRAATTRELALVLLSAGHFPLSLNPGKDKVADVILREAKTVSKARRRIWLTQTAGRYVGPNQPRASDTSEVSNHGEARKLDEEG